MTPIQQPAAFDNGFEIYAAKWGKDEAKKLLEANNGKMDAVDFVEQMAKVFAVDKIAMVNRCKQLKIIKEERKTHN